MEQTKSAGIDYSTGFFENRSPETGIHYGVIPFNEVLQAWSDSSEPYYHPACPLCGGDIAEDKLFTDFTCPNCGEEVNEYDFDCLEATSYYINDNEYQAESSGDMVDIFIAESPYYTTCNYCSPCAPGAGYLTDYNSDGIKTYCFGHDWFEDGKAPYKVFDVKTNKEVKPQ